MARTTTHHIEERTIEGEKVEAVVEQVSRSLYIATLFSQNGDALYDRITNSMGSAVRWARNMMDDLEAWVVA